MRHNLKRNGAVQVSFRFLLVMLLVVAFLGVSGAKAEPAHSLSTPGTYPGSFKTLQALSRAAGQIGKTYQPNGTQWACWCDRFAAFTYGLPRSGFNTAWDHYKSVLARGMIRTDRNPPMGALVYYDISRPYGHVAFSVGGGVIITTPFNSGCRPIGVVYKTTLGAFSGYKGWAWPDWPV